MGWIMRIVGALCVAAALVVGALVLLPGDRIARIAADQLSARTGRAVTIDGDVRVTLWPVLGVETGAVSFANAAWAGPEPMFRAEAVSIGVDAAGLLGGDVRVRQVIARAPVLRLESAGGRANWRFGEVATGTGAPSATGSTAAPETDPALPVIELVELRDARLVLVEEGATRLDIGAVDLNVDWGGGGEPLRARLSAAPAGAPVRADLTLGEVAAFLAGAPVPLSLDATAASGAAGFSGRVSADGAFDGDMTLRSDNTADFAAALGLGRLSVPTGLGRSAAMQARVTYTAERRLSLREMQMQLDGNNLTGDADLVLGARPTVTARLVAGTLDLRDAGHGTGAAAGAGGSDGAPAGWSDAPIDASALALADGDLSLSVQGILLPGTSLGESRLRLSVERARAVLRLQPVTVFSGQLTGELVANNRSGLSVGGRIAAEGVELSEALPVVAGINRLSGRAGGELEFLGVGQSEAAIMASLSGGGRIGMGRGVISGFDLASLGTGGAGGTTVFDSLTASFTMDGGVLRNDDLLMSLGNFRADGAGRVGLGARDIDYLFTPVALRANAGQGLAVPVRIRGPWADPAIQPDLSAVIEAGAGVKLDEVEVEAKEQLRRKLGEELDTEITEGQDVEEVIRDRLEDEARKGLLKLLGAD